jgi:hypothetical protein
VPTAVVNIGTKSVLRCATPPAIRDPGSLGAAPDGTGGR